MPIKPEHAVCADRGAATTTLEATREAAGRVIWITGLSGAGKTTLAAATTQLLKAQGQHVMCLDGDVLRAVFGAAESNPENHGRAARLALALQYAKLCRVLAQQGLTVVIATISLFQEVHHWNRQNLPNYFEVYLRVPLDELRRRDPKGIYSKYDAGHLTSVAGLDLPVDEPTAPDMIADFADGQSAKDLAVALTRKLNPWRKT